jgi:predicted transcriptional regulator
MAAIHRRSGQGRPQQNRFQVGVDMDFPRRSPFTIVAFRIPEDLLREIEKNARDYQVERSVYLREALRKGVLVDRQERWLNKYSLGEATMMEVCQEMNWAPWDFLTHMKGRGLYLNVSLEDWLDAGTLDPT